MAELKGKSVGIDARFGVSCPLSLILYSFIFRLRHLFISLTFFLTFFFNAETVVTRSIDCKYVVSVINWWQTKARVLFPLFISPRKYWKNRRLRTILTTDDNDHTFGSNYEEIKYLICCYTVFAPR